MLHNLDLFGRILRVSLGFLSLSCYVLYHQHLLIYCVYYELTQSTFHCLGGGFNIAPLKPRNGRPRTQVQHLIQIDLKGWGAGYLPAFQQHCLLQMLNSVSGKFFCAHFH